MSIMPSMPVIRATLEAHRRKQEEAFRDRQTVFWYPLGGPSVEAGMLPAHLSIGTPPPPNPAQVICPIHVK